ncbi:MAG: hypothetical protein ACK46E_04280, partial [Pseudanabaena sp.]
MYEYSGDQANISPYSKLKIFIGKMLYRLGIWQISSQVNQQDYQIDLREIYRFCYEYLNSVNNILLKALVAKRFQVTNKGSHQENAIVERVILEVRRFFDP